MLFNIGTGLGPALSGHPFDRFHSYSQILIGYEIVLLDLGEYTFLPVRHESKPTAI